MMQKLLLIRTGALGDIVHSIPLAGALKEAFPECRVSWVIEARYEALIAGVPWVDERIPVRFKEWKQRLRRPEGRREWSGFLRNLRRGAYDVAIDSQGLIRSGCISYLSRAPVRIGFPKAYLREPPSRFFTNVKPTSVPARGHVVDRNLALLHPLGIRAPKRAFLYHLPPAVEEGVKRFQEAEGGPPGTFRVVIHPAAGWPTKEWAPERYAEIAHRLVHERGARVFLHWGPGEKGLAEKVRARCRSPVCLAPEMGLKAMVAFLMHCDLFVGGDSGPMHVASSMGRPVLGLFGPSDAVRNGPVLGRFRVVQADCSCGPCYKRRCDRDDCMGSISVDEVWDTLKDLLDDLASGA